MATTHLLVVEDRIGTLHTVTIKKGYDRRWYASAPGYILPSKRSKRVAIEAAQNTIRFSAPRPAP
jgi:hypothetical protein